jgi:hypothetical protein
MTTARRRQPPVALDFDDPRTYLRSEPWPSETFSMLDDADLERLCIDAGEELLRRYNVRLDAFAQTIKELGLNPQ